MTSEMFFERLWADYLAMTPQAARIRKAFEARGETIVNDHVAFRTLAVAPIGLNQLARHVLALGYREFEQYEFPEKKLHAAGFVPPDPSLPRVFVSELKLNELSSAAGHILRRLAAQVPAARVEHPEILWAGRLWAPITVEEYDLLQKESEYAAWVAALGIRPNHFTISVNHLKHSGSVEDVLQVIEGLGLRINTSGGRVKGSAEVLLEQGSTVADEMPIEFSGGQVRRVPTCYYEFARRYPAADGSLFQGFVAASANRIFESTDRRESV